MASTFTPHSDDSIIMNATRKHTTSNESNYLHSLDAAVTSLPPLSHLLTSEQHELAAAAAAAAAAAVVTPEQQHTSVHSPLSTSSSVNNHTRSLAYIPQQTNAAMYYTQPPLVPPTIPSANMLMSTQTSHPNDVFHLDPQFLPLDATTTSMATINPYPSIAPRRERNCSVSSSGSSDTNKVYSFVAIPGTNQKKRPRRRYDEIERLYHCNWQGCSKAYGTLNHLNAHVSMQKHGPKRSPAEFKEMRKEWRRQKKEREAARKAADEHMKKEIIHHHQQQQQQQQFAVAAAAAAAAMPLHPLPQQLGSYVSHHQIPSHASHYQPISISPNYGMSPGLPGFY
ncbi:hypothetical protein INT44_004864 [Umbelopsis vinacea]|uniref:C2H2-type domain-containing protein n=1 Tax=Umbelopsis vinacea TaxID=44442 RepID=A0A8H7UMH9_9FUNG|nr:hypothetical protein INT44_004864 [Umbelopsis vinacea]